MTEKMKANVKSSQVEKDGMGNAYVARKAGGNGGRGIVVSKVASDDKAKTSSRPPCLSNHFVKPLT